MTKVGPTTVWYADGPGSPRIEPYEALRLAGIIDLVGSGVEVTLGWTIEHPPWIEAFAARPGNVVRTVLAGYGLAGAVNAGQVTALPVRLSAVATRIADDPPDVAVVSGVRRGAQLAFGRSVGWAGVLARCARAVVVEIDETGVDLGAPLIDGNVVATVARPPADDRAVASARPADDVDLRIGALVVSLLPDEPTLQFGPGGISEGILRALHRPVRVWSGLVTDAVAALHDRGLLLAPAVATYTWGGDAVAALAAAGMLDLRPSTVTHDTGVLAQLHRFVGCNTALQVGLDGAVNVERVGGRVVAAVGGHADFCLGATRSPGGLSIVALRSTTANGASTIVPVVDVVSTARSDIQVVVTEHGIADLRGVGDAERARRLVAIAAPHHRAVLISATSPATPTSR